MDGLERPFDPAAASGGRLVVPIGDQDVERLLDKGTDLEMALTETLEASDERQVQPQRPSMIKPLKDPDIITSPHKRIILNDLILNPQQPPHRQQHTILIRFWNDILIRPEHQVSDLQHLNADPVGV